MTTSAHWTPTDVSPGTTTLTAHQLSFTFRLQRTDGSSIDSYDSKQYTRWLDALDNVLHGGIRKFPGWLRKEYDGMELEDYELLASECETVYESPEQDGPEIGLDYIVSVDHGGTPIADDVAPVMASYVEQLLAPATAELGFTCVLQSAAYYKQFRSSESGTLFSR